MDRVDKGRGSGAWTSLRGKRGKEGREGGCGQNTHLNKRNLVVGSIGLVRGPRLGLRLGIENVFFFFF